MYAKILFLCLTGSLTTAFPVFAEDTVTTISSPGTHAINISPLGLLNLSVSGYYEYLLWNRYGIMFNGSVWKKNTETGHSIHLQYRYHYFPGETHKQFNSYFWGPLLYYEKSRNIIEVEDEEYTVRYRALKAGIQWGRRWTFKKHFNICADFGYGFPLYTSYHWINGEAADREKLERLATFIYGFLVELSAGVVF